MSKNIKPKVLFVSHDATRTGAPIIFLNLIEWLMRSGHLVGYVLLRTGGELAPQFASICPTIQVAPYRSRRDRLTRLFKFMHTDNATNIQEISQADLAKYIQQDIKPDIIYSNTATNGNLMTIFSQLGVPIITHIHELDFLIRQRVGAEQFALVRKYTNTFITVSHAVSRNLIDNWDIDPNLVHMVYGFVPDSVIQSNHVNRANIQSKIRKELGIEPGDLVIGGSGHLGWIKGPEHIIQLALYLTQRADRKVHVVWLGGHASPLRVAELKHDIDAAGLNKVVHLLGSKPNPLDYFTIFDIFAMVSREDPFPLVNMEVAMLDIPIVCFKNSGGTSEFVADECGIEVDYLDVNAMANEIISLINNPIRFKAIAAKAKKRVIDNHTIDTGASTIEQIILEQLKSH